MAKNIAVTDEQVENNPKQKERKRVKELRAHREALAKPAFDALTANQRNELVRTVLLTLVQDALRDERADIQAQKAK